MRILGSIAALGLGIALGHPAAASTPGTEAVGTVNVTVVIPPLAQAVAAQRDGASGLWSILNGNQGLMVSGRKSEAGEDFELHLYAPDLSAVTVRSADGALVLPARAADPGQDLQHSRISLPLGDGSQWVRNAANPRSKVFIISTL
ncbi:hypothetical protein [Altererythrobacter sp. C41]|uniref:hypothetical protein n=1 Tax=Altererythrobacter sp. C41 TaxID=2806021 RepID=UPI001933C96E|nr:hypothetical protein [Altererythrobacter sp. C41]MBM0171001.1 hypothetical protein [Altererythrobacter sp. C41]